MSVQLIDTYKLINKVWSGVLETSNVRIRTPRWQEGRESARGAVMTAEARRTSMRRAARGAARQNPTRRKRVRYTNIAFATRKSKKEGPAARREAPQSQWDDEHHDYKLEMEDAFGDIYTIKERTGKGSFGRVVRARDERTGTDVAIKIIKSKKPFALQAQTEIELPRALRVGGS